MGKARGRAAGGAAGGAGARAAEARAEAAAARLELEAEVERAVKEVRWHAEDAERALRQECKVLLARVPKRLRQAPLAQVLREHSGNLPSPLRPLRPQEGECAGADDAEQRRGSAQLSGALPAVPRTAAKTVRKASKRKAAENADRDEEGGAEAAQDGADAFTTPAPRATRGRVTRGRAGAAAAEDQLKTPAPALRGGGWEEEANGEGGRRMLHVKTPAGRGKARALATPALGAATPGGAGGRVPHRGEIFFSRNGSPLGVFEDGSEGGGAEAVSPPAEGSGLGSGSLGGLTITTGDGQEIRLDDAAAGSHASLLMGLQSHLQGLVSRMTAKK